MGYSIEIDETLLQEALKATGLASTRAVVEEGLRLLVKVKEQGGIRRLRGKIALEGDASDAEIGEELR